MLHIINNQTNPFFNLALEEYFLKTPPVDGDLVIFWQNAPTVVIGRNQNPHAEVNLEFARQRRIQVVRRLSGGGAVYHDAGNLNFTFISPTAAALASPFDFARFTAPIIRGLAALGLEVTYSGRNDLTIQGAKFSGNAQYFHQHRILHHGTLLFDTDTEILSQVLSGPSAKHSRRSVPSQPSRITMLRPLLPEGTTMDDLTRTLVTAVFESAGQPYQSYSLTAADEAAIQTLAVSRYQQSAWTFDKGLDGNCKAHKKFPGGTLEVELLLWEDIIQGCQITGDFFASDDIVTLTQILVGSPYEQAALLGRLSEWFSHHTLHGITPEDVAELILSARKI